MIDLRTEQVLSLADACSRLPRRNGRKLHVSTLYRWAQRGIKGVRLETGMLGGARVTSLEALQRFMERLSGIQGEHVTPRDRAGSRTRIARAEAYLRSQGFRARS